MKARRMVVGRQDDCFELNWASADEKARSRRPGRETMSRSRIRMGSAFRGPVEAGVVEFLNFSSHTDLQVCRHPWHAYSCVTARHHQNFRVRHQAKLLIRTNYCMSGVVEGYHWSFVRHTQIPPMRSKSMRVRSYGYRKERASAAS